MRRTRLTALGLAVLLGSGCCPRRRPARRPERAAPTVAVHRPRQRPPGPRDRRARGHRRRAPPHGTGPSRRPRPTTSAATSSATSTPAPATRSRSAAARARVRAGPGPRRRRDAAAVALLGPAARGRQPHARPAATATSRPATARRSRSRSSCPGPADQGPYPAVVEYSGYDPSSPTTGQPQYKLLAPALGMAWVGVNIRGTGCSGGAYNFFENLQSLDGYDAIETVAAQPWSTGRVGMVGISFAGISQLFVARTQPPHLAAITPLSVIDDTWRGTLYPGGIYNDGFAKGWAEERLEQNKWPNPNAPGWVKDAHRRRRHDVRGQHAAARPERRPARADREAPVLLRARPAVPLRLPRRRRLARAAGVRQATSRRRCSSPARGRTSRPAAAGPTCSTASRRRRRSGRSARTASTPSRSTRRCSPR